MPARISHVFTAAVAAFILSGCAGTPVATERTANELRDAVGGQLGDVTAPEGLPGLTAQSRPDEYLRFALLKHPSVRGAFHEWSAAVSSITPARSLPDPAFTFQADIADTLMSLMPGVMFDFMTPGKRAAMGNEVAAGSQVAYRNYVTVLLTTAAEVRRSWIELAYVDEMVRLQESKLGSVRQAFDVAAAEYATTPGMASLEAQLGAENAAGQVQSELDALADRRVAARARFKAALGLQRDDVDPPWPAIALSASTLPSEDEIWQRALHANTGIATMRAMVDMAVAGVEVANKTKTPNFVVGGMVDLKASPLMFRPVASVSLPIWRDKIRATIAAAEARRDAAQSRLQGEEVNLAAEIAQMIYMVRQADRMISYLDATALPNLDRSLASAQASYESGMGAASMIPGIRVMRVDMEIERTRALREREDAITSLLVMTSGILPEGAPLPAGGDGVTTS